MPKKLKKWQDSDMEPEINKEMANEFVISITNKQCVEGQIEELTLVTTGSYLERAGKRYIVYREYDQESGRSQTSTLKIDSTRENKMVSLIRHGSGRHTNLILESGKRHLCQYGTTYGDITLGVFTLRVDDQLSSQGGNLRVEYTLDINSNLSSTNSISISVRENLPQESERVNHLENQSQSVS